MDGGTSVGRDGGLKDLGLVSRLACVLLLVGLASGGCEGKPHHSQPPPPMASGASAQGPANDPPTALHVPSANPASKVPERAGAGAERSPVDELLEALPPRWAGLVAEPERYRLQILLSEVSRPKTGAPQLSEAGYRIDAEYFYPASAIKTFVSAAALRALRELAGQSGLPLGPTTPLRLCVGPQDCRKQYDETNLAAGRITIGHEIRKMQLVSDNRAFARLYDFVGHRRLNEIMAEWGFASVRLRHRMGGSERAGRITGRTELLAPEGSELAVAVPARHSDLVLAPTSARGMEIGSAYIDISGRRRGGPRHFGDRNYASLRDLQRLNVALVLPQVIASVADSLGDEYRHFLVAAMEEAPLASANPRYAGARHAEARYRPLLAGLTRVIERQDLRYVGKAGHAYGFVVANAYLEHHRSGRAVFVTAVLHANSNDVVNDDDYEYETVGYPFMNDLGEAIARTLLSGA